MSAQYLFFGSFMKLVSMAEQPHISIRSPCAMPSAGWSGVKLTAIGLWSSGNAFYGLMKMGESGFGGCKKNATVPARMHSANCILTLQHTLTF
jgi:hypothetical protein